MSTGCRHRVKTDNPHRLVHTLTDKTEQRDVSGDTESLSHRNRTLNRDVSKPVYTHI